MAMILLAACGGSNSTDRGAQPIRRVGLMHVGLDHVPPSLEPLKARLKQLGWVEGRNIKLIWRNLSDENAAKAQARAFVRDRVDLIVAFEDQSIRAAQAATAQRRMPVVFLHPADPVKAGYVRSLAHPGGNLTGVFGLRDLVRKQLEIYTLAVPGLHRILALVDPQDPSTAKLLKQAQAAAAQLQLELVIRKVSTTPGATLRIDPQRQILGIFKSLRPGEVQGVFVVSPKILFNFSSLLISLAKSTRLPVELNRKEWVEKGALFSFGPDFPLIGRIGARYVDSILRGTKASKLPVEEVPQVEFALNLTTARKLGIHVPQSMIARADKVYG